MDLQSNWLRYGLIYGMAGICLQLVMYYVIPLGLMFQMLLGIIIMVVVFVIAGKAEKVTNGGTLTYGEALKTTYLVGLVGTVIASLFSIIIINLIDPGLADKLTEMAMDSTRSFMESMGMPEEQAAAALEKAEEDMASQFTATGQLLNIVKGAFFILIPAAIVSIFIKKNPDPNQIDIESIEGLMDN